MHKNNKKLGLKVGFLLGKKNQNQTKTKNQQNYKIQTKQKLCSDLPHGAAYKKTYKICHCSQNSLIPKHNYARVKS